MKKSKNTKEKKYWTVSPCGKYLIRPDGKQVTHRVQVKKQLQAEICNHSFTGKCKRTGPPEWHITIAAGPGNYHEFSFFQKSKAEKFIAEYLNSGNDYRRARELEMKVLYNQI